jgi:hypothetical protein
MPTPRIIPLGKIGEPKVNRAPIPPIQGVNTGRTGSWNRLITRVRKENDPRRKIPQPMKGCTIVGIMKAGTRKLPSTKARTMSFTPQG